MLCEFCSKITFQVTQPATITYSRHRPSIGSLRHSAELGCTLCSYILKCLLASGNAPKLERKRSSQIWIKNCPRGTIEDIMRQSLLTESLRVFCGHDSLEWQEPEAEADCYLGIATTDDNLAAPYIEGRIVNGNPTSRSTYHIIQTWLRKCNSQHVQCRPLAQSTFPARLLDVGTTTHPFVKLVTAESGLVQKYVALSYCWGTGETLATTVENLAAHQNQVPCEKLPRTIKDAITVTRDLGIQFLWVDALCIVQDSLDGEDWQKESSKMGSIYGNAYITIAAELSESCANGFLHQRTQGRAAPLQEIPLCLPNGDVKGSVFLCPPLLDEKCYLQERAWAFQESRLSRRVLHYREEGLSLCCREGTWLESVALSFGGISEHQQFSAIRPINISSRSQAENHSDWLSSIEVYSRRSMTKDSDKLPALSGYAHEVHKSVGGSYLAGIWERHFAFGLLWVSDRDHSFNKQTVQKRQPSWSWAAVDSPVSYYWALGGRKHEASYCPQLKLINHRIALSGFDPMGEVLGGELTVSGYIKKVKWLLPPPRRSGVLTTSSDTWYRLVGFEWGKCIFDYDTAEISETVWCLVIATETKSANCLLLDTASGGNYRRVGFARLRRETDTVALLSNFEISVITII